MNLISKSNKPAVIFSDKRHGDKKEHFLFISYKWGYETYKMFIFIFQPQSFSFKNLQFS